MSSILEAYNKYRNGSPFAKLSSHFVASMLIGGALGVVLFRRSKLLRTIPLMIATGFTVGYNYPHYKQAIANSAEAVKKTIKGQFNPAPKAPQQVASLKK